jgi:hypothetical protein
MVLPQVMYGVDDGRTSHESLRTPRETSLGIYWIGPRTCLHAMEYKKICCPYRELNPSFSIIRYTDGVIEISFYFRGVHPVA